MKLQEKRGTVMSEVNLEEGKIEFNGEWLSKEDINRKIQEQITAGNLKFSDLAAALEDLTVALENSHPLEIRIVLPKQDYEMLQTLGGEDDKECIRKAIQVFIGSPARPDAGDVLESEVETVLCPKCNTVMEIQSEQRPLELECSFCGTTVLLENETDDEASIPPTDDPADAEASPPADDPADAEASPPAEEKNNEPRHKDHFIG
jgi:hypothetical protein